MNAFSCINSIHTLQTHKTPIIWVRSKEYSPLSMYVVRTILAQHVSLRTLTSDESDFAQIQMQCAASFLGQTYCYYLGDLSKVLKQKNSPWVTYLSGYTGPHTLLFWADASLIQSPAVSWMIIDIPETVTAKSAKSIVESFYPDQKKQMTLFLNALWHQVSSITFEEFCRFGMYARVIGSDYDQFIQEYISTLVTTDTSLFTLSQHLLGKKTDAFYKLWAQCFSKYSVLFWVSFWSDQVWRATLFVRYMHANKRADAYEIAKSRLPFSFTKTDWYHADQNLLQELHAYICDVDFIIKNGGDDTWLELFFLKWFRS